LGTLSWSESREESRKVKCFQELNLGFRTLRED
jgi:hypothetical protein